MGLEEERRNVWFVVSLYMSAKESARKKERELISPDRLNQTTHFGGKSGNTRAARSGRGPVSHFFLLVDA